MLKVSLISVETYQAACQCFRLLATPPKVMTEMCDKRRESRGFYSGTTFFFARLAWPIMLAESGW